MPENVVSAKRCVGHDADSDERSDQKRQRLEEATQEGFWQEDLSDEDEKVRLHVSFRV
jgi:hypothetical protein